MSKERTVNVELLRLTATMLDKTPGDQINFPTMNQEMISRSDAGTLQRIIVAAETITHYDLPNAEGIDLRTTTNSEIAMLLRYIADMMQE